MKSFFVSYNQADRAWAEWIAWMLEEEGHTTVVQAWDFRPGSNFVLEMQKAAAEAERTIALLSPRVPRRPVHPAGVGRRLRTGPHRREGQAAPSA